ncbi:MAG: DUF424 family protein [archaeon]
MILVKIHQGVVAVCDKDLIGKTISDENLEIQITERFYGGEEKSEEELLNILQDAHNINIIGKESIKFVLKHRFVSEENIIYIGDVPHAQIVEVNL